MAADNGARRPSIRWRRFVRTDSSRPQHDHRVGARGAYVGPRLMPRAPVNRHYTGGGGWKFKTPRRRTCRSRSRFKARRSCQYAGHRLRLAVLAHPKQGCPCNASRSRWRPDSLRRAVSAEVRALRRWVCRFTTSSRPRCRSRTSSPPIDGGGSRRIRSEVDVAFVGIPIALAAQFACRAS